MCLSMLPGISFSQCGCLSARAVIRTEGAVCSTACITGLSLINGLDSSSLHDPCVHPLNTIPYGTAPSETGRSSGRCSVLPYPMIAVIWSLPYLHLVVIIKNSNVPDKVGALFNCIGPLPDALQGMYTQNFQERLSAGPRVSDLRKFFCGMI